MENVIKVLNINATFSAEADDVGAELPEQQTAGSAGVDLRASEDAYLNPGEYKLIKTGLQIALPVGYEGQVRPRSGLAYKHGVTVLNAPGTIDSDYRGEIGVILINHGKEQFNISTGDRIAQLVVAKHEHINFVEIFEMDTTERGSGGFGSTGRR